jgi:hypothetical protein
MKGRFSGAGAFVAVTVCDPFEITAVANSRSDVRCSKSIRYVTRRAISVSETGVIAKSATGEVPGSPAFPGVAPLLVPVHPASEKASPLEIEARTARRSISPLIHHEIINCR